MQNHKLDQIQFDTATNAQMEADLLELKRVLLPELVDENPDGTLLRVIDLVTRFHSKWDRQFVNTVANELFLPTAQTHEGITEGCRRVGYLIEQIEPATVTETLELLRDLEHGLILTRDAWAFETAKHADGSDPVRFEMVDNQFIIPAGSQAGQTFAIAVVQGRTVTGEILGTSDGEPSQEYYTLRGNNIPASIVIKVAGVLYTKTDNLLLADPWDLVYEIRRFTEDGQAIITFGTGDGVSSGHGKKPPTGALIVADYRILPEGENGNVGAGTITRTRPNTTAFKVTNLQAASGYAPREPNDNAKWNAERFARTRDALGRLEQYEAAADALENIGRAYAVAREFLDGTIGVHCILKDGSYPDQDELDLVNSVIGLTPSGTVARACRPANRTFDVTALIDVQSGFVSVTVLAAVESAITSYFNPLNRDEAGNYTVINGMSVYPALLYRIIMGVKGVGGCTIQAPAGVVTMNQNQIPVLGTLSVSEA